MMYVKMNKYQTPIDDSLKESLGREGFEDLMEYIDSVQFIKNLIAPEEKRGYAKDRPKHPDFNDDRILVDLTNPHILEDMDYFRERAIFHSKHKKYTNIRPNPNPNSEWGRFWAKELYRWKYGMVRESDGEWIPGQLYFYWNYSPIWLVEDEESTSSTSGKKKGRRVRAFPKPWLGDYLFYHYMEAARHNGKHGKLLKTRGVGFSFKMGSISPCNMYTLPGSGNPNFHLANSKDFLSGDKGIWGKVVDVLGWIAEETPLPRMRIINSDRDMTIKLGFKDEYGVNKGLESSVTAISLKDNPEKARGVRGPLIHYEEDGLFDNLEKAWNVNRKAVEDGDTAFGFMLAGGTGGTEGASFEGSEKLFYTPDAYNIYSVPNVYDKNTNGSTECGFFWGCYLNRKDCYDMDTGEPDVILALAQVIRDRLIVKYGSSDPNAITQKKAEEPVTPQEAVMRTEGTIFPVADLRDHLETIMSNREKFVSEHYVGDLIRTASGQVIFKPDADKYPIRSYDKVPEDRTGAIEIFQMPKKNGEGQIPWGRYIAGIDPIDSDTGGSLFSIMIMDTFTDRIVAVYTGRPRLAIEAYEISLRMLEFYNAVANYEQNLKGLFSYFDQKRALRYLCDVPQILKDMDYIKDSGYGNTSKGTRASKEVNKWGRTLQAEWMKNFQDGNNTNRNLEDEDGNVRKLNLHSLRDIAYIEEAIKWNADGNFDRVSAAGMLFILREDRYKRTESLKKHEGNTGSDLAQDKFFQKNFKQTRDIRQIRY